MNRTGLVIALAVAVVVGGVFAVYPQFDLDLAALFYDPVSHSFSTWSWKWLDDVRDTATVIITLLVAPAFLTILRKLVLPRRRMLISGRAAIFLIVTLAVGPGILAASAIFALGHIATIHAPARLAVFFPALVFGWLRARTGGIGASIAYHALCNVFSEALGRGYGVY